MGIHVRTAITSWQASSKLYHIINGNGCAHNDEDIFSGRVKIAHSTGEVEQLTGDRDGITVAMTDSDEIARHDVCDWATKEAQ